MNGISIAWIGMNYQFERQDQSTLLRGGRKAKLLAWVARIATYNR